MSKPGASSEASERGATEASLLGGRLAGKTLFGQVAVLAVWPLLEQVLTFCVGLTDLVISGRMAEGTDRVAVLDAMGLGGYVAWYFNILQIAVATGVMALVSRATGAKDGKLSRLGLGQGLWLGIAAGVISWLVLQAGIPLLIQWIDLKEVAAEKATDYLKIFAYSGPFSGAMLAINAALRGSGDTRTPFIGMLVVNLVNILSSCLLVFGPGALGGHGIEGIAGGTLVGWVTGFVVMVILVSRGKGEDLKWSLSALKPHWDTMLRILRVGAPQSLEIAGMWGIHAYGIRVISRLPQEGALGAHILAIRVESMSFLAGFAIATAAAALTGQYLGANAPEMAVKAVRLCWKIAVAIMSTMGLVFIMWGRQILGLIAPDSVMHIDMAAPLLFVCAFSQPFFATCIVLKTSIRGAGATSMVIRNAFVSMIFFRVIVLAVASHVGIESLTTVWIILALDFISQSAIFIRLHFRGKWLDAKV